MKQKRKPIDFARVNAVAKSALPAICARLLPDGRREGNEWVARNPRRADRTAGSFKINLISGRWMDFATDDDRGGDPISLAAYLTNSNQHHAARLLSQMLGLPQGGDLHD